MLWRQDELKNQENGIFAHLPNDKGDKFAQADVSALPVGQQRAGEMALSQLEFKLPNTFPSNGELFLRFGFTNKGEVVGDSVLQIRGAGKAAVTWDNGLVLDRFQVSEKDSCKVRRLKLKQLGSRPRLSPISNFASSSSRRVVR